MRRSTKLPALFVASLFAALLPLRGASGAELLMVEEHGCFWCERWNEEIGVVYHKTDEGRVAPLRRVEIGNLPEDISFSSSPRYTPTFILVDQGVEVGRIEGHPGEDFFWPLLNRLFERLPSAVPATN